MYFVPDGYGESYLTISPQYWRGTYVPKEFWENTLKTGMSLFEHSEHELHTLAFSGLEDFNYFFVLHPQARLELNVEDFQEFFKQEFCKVQELIISNCPVTPNNVEWIKKILSGNPTVTLFRFGFTQLAVENESILVEICQCLESNESVKSFHIYGCVVNESGARALVEIINRLGLEAFSLNNCELQDEGAKVLAEALKTNETLTKLDLASINIGNEGADAFIDALEQNVVLQALNFGDNKNIDPQKIGAIQKALNRNEQLLENRPFRCTKAIMPSDDGPAEISSEEVMDPEVINLSQHPSNIAEVDVVTSTVPTSPIEASEEAKNISPERLSENSHTHFNKGKSLLNKRKREPNNDLPPLKVSSSF